MFSRKELLLFDDNYFSIISCNNKEVIIKSKNTKHCWAIIPYVTNAGKTFKIGHTHFQNRSFHDHANAETVSSAIKKIKQHDDYQIHIRKTEFGK